MAQRAGVLYRKYSKKKSRSVKREIQKAFTKEQKDEYWRQENHLKNI